MSSFCFQLTLISGIGGIDLKEMRALTMWVTGVEWGGRGSNTCKGPEVGGGLRCWNCCKEVSVLEQSC